MPSDSQKVLAEILRLFEDGTARAEIARQMGLTRGAVQLRLNREFKRRGIPSGRQTIDRHLLYFIKIVMPRKIAEATAALREERCLFPDNVCPLRRSK